MFDHSTRIRAYRNFLLHDTGVTGGARPRWSFTTRRERTLRTVSNRAAGPARHARPQDHPGRDTGLGLVPLLKELTADVGDDDALILVMSSGFFMKLMSAPGVGGMVQARHICLTAAWHQARRHHDDPTRKRRSYGCMPLTSRSWLSSVVASAAIFSRPRRSMSPVLWAPT